VAELAAQAMVTVVAGTCAGIPARRAAVRAGFVPLPACRQWPNTTSSTSPGSIPARSTAAAIAAAPSAYAGVSRNAPPKRPMGVRTAETATTS